MSAPRRRLVRPALPRAAAPPQPDPRLQKVRSRLGAERAALARWMAKLRRAFHAAEKGQRKVAYLERQITRLGEGPSQPGAASP
jgi:hypothetical protein